MFLNQGWKQVLNVVFLIYEEIVQEIVTRNVGTMGRNEDSWGGYNMTSLVPSGYIPWESLDVFT